MRGKLLGTSLNLLFHAILIVLSIFTPYYRFTFDSSVILTAISLLFTILIGFFIAATTSKYLNLQSLIAREDACLISLHKTAALLNTRQAVPVAEAIDAYLISALDYGLLDYSVHISKEYDALIGSIDAVTVEDESCAGLLQNLQTKKDEFIAIRMEALLAAQRIVSPIHWTILILLSALIAAVLLTFRTGDIFSSAVIAVIIVVIYQALYLLNTLDSNSFLAEKFGYRVPQAVFLAIGKLKYFPETALASDRRLTASLRGESYRVGAYTDRPRSFAKTIRIVNGE